jgi:hypothetical protein
LKITRPRLEFKGKEIKNPFIKFFLIFFIVILSPLIAIGFFTGLLIPGLQNSKISITKRSDDYHACLEKHPEIWGCGKTIPQAIGDLIYSHRDKFKLVIE